MITITLHQLWLTGLFLYVLIGTIHAFGSIMLSKGFTGRYDLGMAAALFFFWLPMQIMRAPWLALSILAAGLAAGVTYLASMVPTW